MSEATTTSLPPKSSGEMPSVKVVEPKRSHRDKDPKDKERKSKEKEARRRDEAAKEEDKEDLEAASDPKWSSPPPGEGTAPNEDGNLENDEGVMNGPKVVIDPTKDLWQNIALNVRDSSGEPTETNVLVVGATDAGKTTLLQKIYTTFTTSTGGGGRKVKPTTALDYSFARRTDRRNAQVAHLWELAQGIDLAQLADVVITPENVHSMVLCVVVDASDGNGPNAGSPTTVAGGLSPSMTGIHVLWETATYWLKRLDRRVSEILSRMRGKGSSTPEKMANRATKMLGVDHPDLKRMRISGVPTVLVVNKMDKFSGDSAKLKLLAQCMRFVAHLYGAHLIFTGEDGTESSVKWRLLMSHLLFQAPFDTRYIQFDPERGHVLVTADRDTFTDIGDPPITNFSSLSSKAGVPSAAAGDGELDRWGAPFDAAFPPSHVLGGGASSLHDAFLKQLYDVSEEGYGEPLIDALRRQKEEDLEQYRKSMKSKERATRG